MPLPPTRFSTTTGWPSVSVRRAAMRRPTRSGPPPGGIGTSRRTGFEGYCAAATDASRAAAIAGNPLRTRSIAGRSDPIEIVPPHVQVALAGLDYGVFHAQLPREFLHRAPAGVRVLDVGLGVQFEELELVVREAEQLSPAQPLDAEPAVLSEQPAAVARHIDALGAGVGDDAFEPVAVRHQPFPRRPAELRRSERSCLLDLGALQADAHAELLEDLPVRPAAAVRVVGDHLLAAGLDDAHARIPVGAVGSDLELEHRVPLARVQAMLQGEHARAALGERLVEPAAAQREVVHHLVHAGDNAHASSSVTRLLRFPSERMRTTFSVPISAVFATCVPPQACRSMPGISSSRTRPSPRGGATDIVFTSSGRESSSASVIHIGRVCAPAWTSSFTRPSVASFARRSISMSKSRCALSALMRPPVTGAFTTAPRRCSAV